MEAKNAKPVSTRQISADDWPLWRALRQEALRESPEAFGAKLSEWQGAGDTEERWRHRLSTVACNLVAWLGDGAVGMVSGTAPAEDATVYLISMWVAPVARGHGVGDALLDAALSWARTQGASRVGIDFYTTNTRARQLYERHGFTLSETPPLSGDKAERRMIRTLAE